MRSGGGYVDKLLKQIEEEREKLNKLIDDEVEYSIILKKSQELDELLNKLQKNERKKRLPLEEPF